MATGQQTSNSPTPPLNERQRQFVREYLIDSNATQAAIRCGYAAGSATVQGSRLLANAKIQEVLEQAKAERARRTEVSADKVLTDITTIIQRCMQAEPVLDKDGNPTGEYKFDANPALKGLELLGRHLALFTDKTETKLSADASITGLIEQLQGTRLNLR